MNNIKL